LGACIWYREEDGANRKHDCDHIETKHGISFCRSGDPARNNNVHWREYVPARMRTRNVASDMPPRLARWMRCGSGVSLFLRQPAMIGADGTLDWRHRSFRGCLNTFALSQRDGPSRLRVGQRLDLLGHHSPAFDVASCSASCDLEKTQGDDALDFVTEDHCVQPWFPGEHDQSFRFHQASQSRSQ
jgi:hypothetical protein